MRKSKKSIAYRIGYELGRAAANVPDNSWSVWELLKMGIVPFKRGNFRKGFNDGFNESSVQAPDQNPTKP